MDIVYTSPIKFDFFPIPGSILNFKFKLKGTKKRIKVNIDLLIFYKDQFIAGKVFLANSGMQSVYTSSQDENFSLTFTVPEFKQRTQSYINISLDNANIQERVVIEDIQIESDMTYARPSDALAVPNLRIKTVPPIPVPSIPNSENIYNDKIVLVSTWGIPCGIATYTKYLLDELDKISPDTFIVRGIESANNIEAKLIHLQHEFGIMPKPPPVRGKVIITWHTVPNWINASIRQFESNLDVVAHIVHSKGALEYLQTTKDIYVINHGSMQFSQITKEDARKLLGIKTDRPIGFIFGFQSPNKNYNELISAAENTNIHIIISGSRHSSGYISHLQNDNNVTFLDRHLTEEEVNLYAVASDILLFDYTGTNHYSVSGAMHRIIGSGRPVICSDIRHFNDIDIAWKFINQKDLENSIINTLINQEELGKLSSKYAKDTSWEIIARKHVDIYKKYVDF